MDNRKHQPLPQKNHPLMPKPQQRQGSGTIKNKAPAPVQITAEQILREANDRQEFKPYFQKQTIWDDFELGEYRWRKRKGFENALRINRLNLSVWIKYGQFEETQGDFERARSVFERGLVVDPRNQALWMRYIEMEVKNKFINHARNLYDRVVTYMPRVDQFWYKYAYMEEMLGNIAGARQIFERWLKWEPSVEAFNLYIKFEKRYKERQLVREIYRRLVTIHPETKNWVRWSKFEEDNLELDNARQVFEAAVDALGIELADQQLFIAFARFETRMKEMERARAIYQFAIQKLPASRSKLIQTQFAQFEQQFGKRREIEDAVYKKRRLKYEEELEKNPLNYDSWFDLIRLEESMVEQAQDLQEAELIERTRARVRDVYEQAIAKVPAVQEKRFWRRYIYLWVYYAVFEELTCRDYDRTRQIYQACLKVIPHKQFTFAKIWLMFAKFEIRRLDLQSSRKILGRSIGMCPKDKLFKGYIEIELELREFDRCRILYEKFLTWSPSNVYAWMKFAELERLLDDIDRSRAIFELAIAQPLLDMPEVLWKAYIDAEYEEQEWDRVRELYRRLLDRTNHPKVWTSFAEFEFGVPVDEEAGDSEVDTFVRARSVFSEGYKHIKDREGGQEERRMLLITWLDFERNNYDSERFGGDVDSIVDELEKKLPRQVKKRRRIYPEDPEDTTMEEYIDYLFPEDEDEKAKKGAAGVNKLLQMAQKWKQSQQQEES